MLPRLALTLALVVVVCPRSLFAQTPQSELDNAAPAHVSYVEGTATLERDGRPENAPLNMPLLSGDRLRTIDGRVEVLFADGSALHLDSRTTMDIQSDELVRLIDGRLRINIAGSAQDRAVRGVAYRVDSPAGSVRITQAGEYRIAMLRREDQTQLELAVLRGFAEIFTDEGTTAVRAGERAYASAGLAPSYAYTYNSANWDAFDRWSESRRDRRMGASAQYLPSEVRAYASTFDEEGDWRYEESYGQVWYPRVAVGWRPYYYGRWAQYPRYGWTWIGADRFGWPTHHYGRWGFRSNAWFWIPAPYWAPAHVSWAYAPGYVSWCPLGFNNRPVIGVNIYNVGVGYYSSSRAWTTIGYSHFGRSYVHHRAVDWDRYDRTRRPAFQVGQSAPAYRDGAVSRPSTTAQGAPSNVEGRNAAPIRWAGSRTVPSDRLRQGSGARESGSIPAGGRRSELPPSGARSAATAAPRYINRGDEIVRSRTERPSAPSPDLAGAQAIPDAALRGPAGARTGYAVQRTAPGGPARRIDTPGIPAGPDPSGLDRSRSRDVGAGRNAPRTIYDVPDQSQPRGGVTPPPDHPVYQPYQPPVRSYERSAQPRGATPAREPSAEAAPGAPSQGYARPRGGFEPRPAPAPAPSAGSGRQAPAPHAMPAQERSVPSGGAAVPRDGGGRGPAPSGAGSGARSRGRGGV